MDSPSLGFFFSICLILIFPSPLQAHADLIADVCEQTIDNSGCLSVLRADPHTSSAKNSCELSKLALELALNRGTETQAFFVELQKTNNSPFIRHCATFCYDGVVGSFKSALLELKEDVQTANYDAKVAGDNAQECHAALVSHGIQNQDIWARNKDIMLLSSIAFVATSKLPDS